MKPETIADEIEFLEKVIEQSQEKIKRDNPDVASEMEKIEKERLDELKKELKDVLIKTDDMDVHEADKHKYSVSKVIRLETVDIDSVPTEFKSLQMVADERKAQDYYKLMGVPPRGFKDKSYHRLNWKEY